MNQRLLFVLGLGFVCGTLASSLSACTVPNPDHCVNNGGDEYCMQQHPEWTEAYCSDNSCVEPTEDGCQEMLPSGCWYCDGKPGDDCTGMATGDGDGDGDGEPTGDGDGDGDGEPTGDGDGDGPCVGPEDCSGPEAPFCVEGDCVACDGTADPDGECAGVDPGLPVCVSGVCMACAEGKEDACVDTTPICDTDANMCVACSGHDQCPDSACNMAAGNCIDPANIIHVAGSDLDCDNNGEGSLDVPYCDLVTALINAPAEPLIILHELNQNASYQEDVVIMGTVGLFAADGEQPRLLGVNNMPAITVAASGEFFMRGVWISGGPIEGFRVNGGSAWVDRSRIINNAGGGVSVQNEGSLTLENCFIGGDVNQTVAVSVEGGSVYMSYTTVFAGFGSSSALTCGDGMGSIVRNSLLVSNSDADEVQCPNLDIEGSALEMNIGGTNVALGPLDPAWFVPAYSQGDFHLSGTHPVEIETAATWLPGDPATDIDGDPRPTTDGAADFAGADRL